MVAKQYAMAHGETISPNRELVALGCANLVGAFFGAFPASGSLSRSKVNDLAGAQTPLSNFFAAIVVMFAILFLLPVVAALPIPVTRCAYVDLDCCVQVTCMQRS